MMLFRMCRHTKSPLSRPTKCCRVFPPSIRAFSSHTSHPRRSALQPRVPSDQPIPPPLKEMAAQLASMVAAPQQPAALLDNANPPGVLRWRKKRVILPPHRFWSETSLNELLFHQGFFSHEVEFCVIFSRVSGQHSPLHFHSRSQTPKIHRAQSSSWFILLQPPQPPPYQQPFADRFFMNFFCQSYLLVEVAEETSIFLGCFEMWLLIDRCRIKNSLKG